MLTMGFYNVVLLFLTIIIILSQGLCESTYHRTSPDWSQQYGDPYSTSYTDYSGDGFNPGWNYTTQAFVSQKSPCVDHNGVIYYPLRAYVVAIAPNGTELWKAGVAPNGNAYLTNTLYSGQHNYVIVGSSWVQQETFFQIVAVDAIDGSVVWTSMQNKLYHATTISLSPMADHVYAAGYDHGTFAAVSLSDGKLVWAKNNVYQVGIFMQTKVGPMTLNVNFEPLKRSSRQKVRGVTRLRQEAKEIVLLPTDPWDGFEGKGRLFAYGTAEDSHTEKKWSQKQANLNSSASTPHLQWYSDLGFTAGALFAFSNRGILYGSNGGSEGSSGALFFVNVTNGSLLYTDDGYCDRGPSGLSGPVVDQAGFVYYSCGNQAFSLNKDGSLRWQSDKFGNSTLGSITPPSLHPDGFVYFIHQNGIAVYRLATKDGTLNKTYSVTQLGYFEPPIIVGSRLMYLIGFQGSAVVIFPIEL